MTDRVFELPPAPKGTEYRQALIEVGDDRKESQNLHPTRESFEIDVRSDADIAWVCNDIGEGGEVLHQSGTLGPHQPVEKISKKASKKKIVPATVEPEDTHPVFEPEAVEPETEVLDEKPEEPLTEI